MGYGVLSYRFCWTDTPMQLERRGAWRWLLLLAALWLVQACGQKGPLYLPDDARHSQERKK